MSAADYDLFEALVKQEFPAGEPTYVPAITNVLKKNTVKEMQDQIRQTPDFPSAADLKDVFDRVLNRLKSGTATPAAPSVVMKLMLKMLIMNTHSALATDPELMRMIAETYASLTSIT